MAVYLPDAKVAIEIVDDPLSLPADLDAFPGYTIVTVTSAEVCDPVAFHRVAERVGAAAGVPVPPDTPEAIATRKRLMRRLDKDLHLAEYARAMGISLVPTAPAGGGGAQPAA